MPTAVFCDGSPFSRFHLPPVLLRSVFIALIFILIFAPLRGEAAGENNNPESTASDELDSDYLDEDLDFLDEEEEQLPTPLIWDPLEPWNRGVFKFNTDTYFILFKPMAEVYEFVTPSEIRLAIKNFFFNLGSPMRLLNCLLQGKFHQFGQEFGRFFINTTVGLGGVGNAAEHFPSLNPDEEDLGQTLGYWGLGHGFYIVWPFWDRRA